MVKLKVGRNILDISENDLILDNGACYQIVTQKLDMDSTKQFLKWARNYLAI